MAEMARLPWVVGLLLPVDGEILGVRVVVLVDPILPSVVQVVGGKVALE